MKILFCTNTFSSVHHGPAKFAQYLLLFNKLYPNHELRILTQDIPADTEINETTIYKLILKPNLLTKFIPSLERLKPFYERTREIKQSFDYDILVYNNAITAYYHAVKDSEIPVIGFVNDDNYLTHHISDLKKGKQFIKQWVLSRIEGKSCRNLDL